MHHGHEVQNACLPFLIAYFIVEIVRALEEIEGTGQLPLRIISHTEHTEIPGHMLL